MKYQVILYWRAEDSAFFAQVPELPGCMADGPTKAKALRAVEIIADEWIETATELGRPIPEPKGRLAMPNASYNDRPHHLAKLHEPVEGAGLAKILRRAKKQDAGSPGISLAEMKRRLRMTAGRLKRSATTRSR